MAQTLRLLAKSSSTPALFCTGAVLQDTLDPIGFRPLFFRPEHACKLSNEFRVYSNYDARGALGGWETEGKEELDASRGLEQGSKASTGALVEPLTSAGKWTWRRILWISDQIHAFTSCYSCLRKHALF
eukprot:g37234.t1